MDFLKLYKKMISLRGLTDHTMKSYCTYITAYLDFIQNTLHKSPSQVGYSDIIRFLDSLQTERELSDRTINNAISQIRFFTLYVLHKPWDSTQIPMRKFDTYLPFVPTKDEVKTFISTMSEIKITIHSRFKSRQIEQGFNTALSPRIQFCLWECYGQKISSTV